MNGLHNVSWKQLNIRRWFLGLAVSILALGGLSVYCYQKSGIATASSESTESMEREAQTGQRIALTFDDGPHPVYTPLLLDGLKKREVTVTFFVTGENVELYPELVRRMDEEGHQIGNHTYSHLQLTPGNSELFQQELQKTNEVIKNVTGKNTEYVRPPYGSWNKRYEETLDMIPVLWDIDPLDWCSSDTACIVKRVLSHLENHSIILMHDQYPSSVTAALQVIDILQKRGYEFVNVEEILFD